MPPAALMGPPVLISLADVMEGFPWETACAPHQSASLTVSLRTTSACGPPCGARKMLRACADPCIFRPLRRRAGGPSPFRENCRPPSSATGSGGTQFQRKSQGRAPGPPVRMGSLRSKHRSPPGKSWFPVLAPCSAAAVAVLPGLLSDFACTPPARRLAGW